MPGHIPSGSLSSRMPYGYGWWGCGSDVKPTVHPNKKRSIKLSEIALNNYRNFISSKRIVSRNKGIDVPLAAVNPILFPFQRDIVRWACAKK